MQGFNKGFKPKSKRVEGKIRGPGTGTSDDIKTQVPEGSYIMPADSTQAIGEQNLAGMGAPVDVNASNGEFALPPEQVHAVGVQALNQMRDQTHTPTGQPQVQGSAERPDLFFADGGLVEDPRRRTSQSRALVPVSQPATASATTPQASAQPNPGTMYTNSSGQTGRGFMPSSSSAVVPAGPVVDQPRPEGIDQATRDRVRRRVQADTADWQQHRASQDARFASAGAQPDSAGGRLRAAVNRARGLTPKGSAGVLGAASSALPEALDVYDVATDPNTTGLDVATQASEGVSRMAATTAGAAGGAKLGATIGAFGGPTAPLTVPLATGAGALAGGALGYWGSGKIIEKGRELFGASPDSPIDRVNQSRPATPPATPPAAEPGAPDQPAASVSPQAAPAPESGMVAPQLENNVIREGNSFYADGPITEGFTINGQNPATMVNTVRSPQNEQAVQALLARTPEFGTGTAAVRDRGFQPAGARVTVVPDSGRLESERRRAFAAASTPHPGAQNRQLTAAQINAMRGLIGDERTADNQRYATDASLTREEMSQAGADRRAASRDAIDLRRVTGEEESRGFQNRAAARVERLYEQYEQASTPEEKSAIAEQLRVLSGDSQAPRFAVAAGGQIIDPITQQLTTQPAQIFNTQTGEFVQQQGAPGMQVPPRQGEVRGGYRFKGGNPADQKNWEKI